MATKKESEKRRKDVEKSVDKIGRILPPGRLIKPKKKKKSNGSS